MFLRTAAAVDDVDDYPQREQLVEKLSRECTTTMSKLFSYDAHVLYSAMEVATSINVNYWTDLVQGTFCS
jgi:hypothetical protein